jgi:hypothetical protein
MATRWTRPFSLVTVLPVVAAALALAGCGASSGAPAGGGATSTTVRYSQLHQPTVTSQPLNLGPVRLAEETACLSDAQVIRMAEDYFWTLNGHFATMAELVTGQFVHTVSQYFSSVRIGAPVGGYTLVPVATGPCGPHVVTAAQNAG